MSVSRTKQQELAPAAPEEPLLREGHKAMRKAESPPAQPRPYSRVRWTVGRRPSVLHKVMSNPGFAVLVLVTAMT